MSVQQEKNIEEHLGKERDLTWFATFKDTSMEQAFNDYNWKAVYARYRLLFVVMTTLIGLMVIAEVVNTQDYMRMVREGGSWILMIFVMQKIYNFTMEEGYLVN